MIEVKDLTVSFGGRAVLQGCALRVADGMRAALTGPSGCGKTTLLRCAAGLRKPDTGSVTVGGRVAYAFQEPRLFPWLTAVGNLELVAPGRAGEWLEKAGLSDAAGKYPAELSGGMRQRLNILRALAYGGDALLLDEPFKGMDAPLRREMMELIRRESEHKSVLLVTHDEADLALADVVYEYREGKFWEC